MHYTYTEDYVSKLFKSISLYEPKDLNIPYISKKLQINVYYADQSFRIGNNIIIEKSTKEKEWQLFGHEIGHYLIHAGNQLHMFPLFRDLQEWQANLFAYNFCVPTFMLEQIQLKSTKHKSAIIIAETFNVEYEFARKRLDMYINKFYSGGIKNVLQKT